MTMGLVHAARQIEAQGRGPDTSLAHISPDESAMLDYMQGGRRMNPVTGLAEYGLFGKILKAVARVGATLGAGVISGFNPYVMAAANGAATKLTGGSWKQAGIGALTTGLTAGLAGPSSFSSNPFTALKEGALGSGTLGATAASTGANSLGQDVVTNQLTGMTPTSLGQLGNSISQSAPSLLSQGVNYLKTTPGMLIAGGTALGALSGKGTPATPLPMPYQEPYDPKNVPSWMRRPSQQVAATQPMDFYQNNMPNVGMYADGGDVAPVGMGLPQSAAMPQLMSAAQWGYVNARAGGRINGPGDGKSDDIPALLSNGEHVIDAATVSDLGNGDNDTGQKRIEELKQKIRSNAGRKNPRKASPKQKGLGSLLNSARA